MKPTFNIVTPEDLRSPDGERFIPAGADCQIVIHPNTCVTVVADGTEIVTTFRTLRQEETCQ